MNYIFVDEISIALIELWYQEIDTIINTMRQVSLMTQKEFQIAHQRDGYIPVTLSDGRLLRFSFHMKSGLLFIDGFMTK